ncbi:substrate-binding domain-containing protein [Nonomuraea indica]|uniref:Substrate-binding domain-containing protein n=1 Tax=Nonomuraea indica TaxID=1581193 RepID=A0ABW8A9P0_9ACTN
MPEEVSIVGFDDTPMTACLDPPLTTIRQPVRDMAPAAVAGLLDEIRGLPAPRGALLHRLRAGPPPLHRPGPHPRRGSRPLTA